MKESVWVVVKEGEVLGVYRYKEAAQWYVWSFRGFSGPGNPMPFEILERELLG